MPEANDPVVISVDAYSDGADAYEATHAMRMHGRVERFSQLLWAPSLILDAGCGPGRDLARFASMGHVPRGVDLNSIFVAKASVHAPTWLVDLREIDGLFPPGLFVGIWACSSLVHLPESDTRAVLGSFAALLRPGGKLYACVNTTGRTGWLDEPDGRRWYEIWEPEDFSSAVSSSGFDVDAVDHGPVVEVWATLT